MQKASFIPKHVNKYRLVKSHAETLPFFQPKLIINQPNDIYEHEANTAAEQVMRMPDKNTFFKPAADFIQRKCSQCEEEEKNVQMRSQTNALRGMTAPSSVDSVINSTGQSLDAGTRNFMESRFAYDFGNVQIHNDSLAHQSSADISALAYTHRNHIVFGAGQYQPNTNSGRQLLAHELAHVVQQKNKNQALYRMKIGKGAAPLVCKNAGDVQLEEASAGDTDTLDSAIEKIKAVAYNSEKYSDCHSFFGQVCPGGNKNSLKQIFDKVTVWKCPDKYAEEDAAFVCSDVPFAMAYTSGGIQKGATELAKTMTHELGHSCGIGSKGDHRLADKISLYCMGAGSNKISVAVGKSGDLLIGAIAYQRFLKRWLAGQVRPSVGLDVNFIKDQAQPTSDIRPVIAATLGLELRTDLWGAERFGGLFLEAEAGSGIGKFRNMETAEANKFNWQAGYVLQLKTGAEFAIPFFGVEGQVLPISVEVALKTIRPVNREGEAINEIAIGIGAYF